jgi:hypothetical protein
MGAYMIELNKKLSHASKKFLQSKKLYIKKEKQRIKRAQIGDKREREMVANIRKALQPILRKEGRPVNQRIFPSTVKESKAQAISEIEEKILLDLFV